MNRKYIKKLCCAGAALLLLGLQPLNAKAAVPYETFTAGEEGNEVPTQTAYRPSMLIKAGLNGPEDLFFEEETGRVYIADTQNSRLLMLEGEKETEIGKGILNSPTGVCGRDGSIYVADSGAKKIFSFDGNGRLIKEYGRPKEALFGKKTQFVPQKVSVDKRGNIYVAAKGSGNGIIQLNRDGSFLGYIGSNQAGISFDMLMKRLFFTKSQKNQLFKNLPPSPTSISMDNQGLIYTATFGLAADPVKKFNAAGNSMLAGKMGNRSEKIMDVDVDRDGNIYSVGGDGIITETDSYGNYLFGFGGRSKNLEIGGLLKTPSAIDVTDSGELYVLDKEQNLIQVYERTEFAVQVHKGVALYKDGRYVEGEKLWEEVLRKDSSFRLAYQALAKAYYKEQKNDKALSAFQEAGDKEGYSSAYWEIRNQWLQDNLGVCLMLAIGLLILWKTGKYLYRRKKGERKKKGSWEKENKAADQLKFLKQFLLHPTDAFAQIHFQDRVTVKTAAALTAVLLVIHVAGLYVCGYLFRTKPAAQINVLTECGKILIPMLLFVICNYLTAAINDGEGRLKDVYTGTVCALTPYLIAALPLYLLTNILTLNEAFIFQFGTIAMYAWCLVLLFIMVKEIHNYSVGKTIKIILLTLFTAAMLVLFAVILYVLAMHFADFVQSIAQEMRAHG